MKLDVKKTSKNPQDEFEARRLLVETQADLTTAMFIMDSIRNDDRNKLDEFHLDRMKNFIEKYE